MKVEITCRQPEEVYWIYPFLSLYLILGTFSMMKLNVGWDALIYSLIFIITITKIRNIKTKRKVVKK